MPTVHVGYKIPSSITEEHIQKAIHEIDKFGVPSRRKSTNYCLVHDQRHYPPKYVISMAAKHAIGRELNPNEFYGGEGPDCANGFLKRKGFKVIECKCNRVFHTAT